VIEVAILKKALEEAKAENSEKASVEAEQDHVDQE